MSFYSHKNIKDFSSINKHMERASKSNYYLYNPSLKEKARVLRKTPTLAEKKIWYELLSNKQLRGFRFYRQRPVLHYIADFMCKELTLIIEIDGFTHEHEAQWKYDVHRQQKLEAVGFTVLRFKHCEVMNDFLNVRLRLEGWIDSMMGK